MKNARNDPRPPDQKSSFVTLLHAVTMMTIDFQLAGIVYWNLGAEGHGVINHRPAGHLLSMRKWNLDSFLKKGCEHDGVHMHVVE